MAKGGIDLQLTGFDEVINVFKTLEPKMQKKAIRPALRAGAKVTLKAQKALIPSDSGNWKASMKVKSMKRSRSTLGVVIQSGTREDLGISSDDPFYYPAVIEYGSRKRGIAAQSPLRRGLATSQHAAMQKIGETISKKQDDIVKAMKKVT